MQDPKGKLRSMSYLDHPILTHTQMMNSMVVENNPVHDTKGFESFPTTACQVEQTDKTSAPTGMLLDHVNVSWVSSRVFPKHQTIGTQNWLP